MELNNRILLAMALLISDRDDYGHLNARLIILPLKPLPLWHIRSALSQTGMQRAHVFHKTRRTRTET